MSTYSGVNTYLAKEHSVLNMKAVVASLNKEKALVGAFSVIVKSLRTTFEALLYSAPGTHAPPPATASPGMPGISCLCSDYHLQFDTVSRLFVYNQ